MRLYNIKHKEEVVNFKEALMQGIGRDGGLFFPEALPYFNEKTIDKLLSQNFVPRSCAIMQELLKNEFAPEVITQVVTQALNFPIELKQISEKIYALELFWGPTLAFKDFGARFMAQIFQATSQAPMTIISATSGDTGAAIAHAFYGMPNIQVVILYPHNRISLLQEKLFCTLGGNIHTFAVEGSFDDCQALVKQCFADPLLNININSGNSINISRILAQTLYYFEALAQLPTLNHIVVSVPSGNFGNLTAGLFAQQMGLPVSAFIAATNSNDTVPRYLHTSMWDPHATIPTLSNAMDVSLPNNWPRIEETHQSLRSVAVTEVQTQQAMQALQNLGYIADPHSAVAYQGLLSCLAPHETGIFLCTAHSAKFQESVEAILGTKIVLPEPIQKVVHKKILSQTLVNDYTVLKQALKNLA